jgi:hypothetical protein
MTKLRTYLAYCAGRDQKVRVIRRSELPLELGAVSSSTIGSDVICLAYGTRCTGSICPLFDVPTEEMRRRLVQAGLMACSGASMPGPQPSAPA